MKAINISESEWEIMNIIWSEAPVSATDIISELSESKGWHSRTIRTMLDRLVKKGALEYEREGKRYLYSAAISRDDCTRKESDSFINRVFGGKPASMILNMVKETKLSKEEIKELKRLLKEKE